VSMKGIIVMQNERLHRHSSGNRLTYRCGEPIVYMAEAHDMVFSRLPLSSRAGEQNIVPVIADANLGELTGPGLIAVPDGFRII
jgi:hypothetical protein